MESSRAKYKIGTKVKYKLNDSDFNVQCGTIIGSYCNSYSNKVYYDILRGDEASSNERVVTVPEDQIIFPKYKISDNVIINDNEEDYGDEG